MQITNKNIPIYDLSESYDINITPISHNNDYDFNEVHSHNYYEILFFTKGGGYQLIDFEKIHIKPNSCYIVKPKQVHLVKRKSVADGMLIQFTQKMLLSDILLNFLSVLTDIGSATVFEESSTQIKNFLNHLKTIKDKQTKKSLFYREKSIHLLSNLLYSLEEVFTTKKKHKKPFHKKFLNFVSLVESNLTQLSVREYARKLNMSPKNLNALVKDNLGATPLKYIHNVLLTHIKRDLAFKDLSHKEIAYIYNFDSPSNFSLFVKKHTGFSPSDLQKKLISIS